MNIVNDNDQMARVVEVANEKLYNLHTRVAIKHIEKDDLRQIEPTPNQPKTHCTLMDFDLGTDAIEVIFLRDFYGRVLKDLGMHQGVTSIPEEM